MRKKPWTRRDAQFAHCPPVHVADTLPCPRQLSESPEHGSHYWTFNFLSVKYTDWGKRIYLSSFISVKWSRAEGTQKAVIEQFWWSDTEIQIMLNTVCKPGPTCWREVKCQEDSSRVSLFVAMQIYLCRQERFPINMCSRGTHRGQFSTSSFSSFPTPQQGFSLKWVMSWLPLMWMVNTSSPTLQSQLVNIYRDWGILSCMRRSIYIPTNTGEEWRRRGCQSLQRHQIMKSLVKAWDGEGASYLWKEISHFNEHISWKFNTVFCCAF